MINLIPIGFGLMVLGLRLMMIRNSLRRGQTPTEAVLKRIAREGLILLGGGVFILVLTVIWKFAITEFPGSQVLLATGASIAYLSLPGLLQWIVAKGGGTERQVYLWAIIVTAAGALLVFTYIVYQIVVTLT